MEINGNLMEINGSEVYEVLCNELPVNLMHDRILQL